MEVESNAPVTLHKSTRGQEHRLLGKLHSLEGKINKVCAACTNAVAHLWPMI